LLTLLYHFRFTRGVSVDVLQPSVAFQRGLHLSSGTGSEIRVLPAETTHRYPNINNFQGTFYFWVTPSRLKTHSDHHCFPDDPVGHAFFPLTASIRSRLPSVWAIVLVKLCTHNYVSYRTVHGA
jgi:hypothetical protein